ncbi:hypothetical protein EJ06DRAFT_529177 [Trichodelitschia bisporula]|uniref:Pentacotripeptide-repeat region of PRORP domain-containing protein n=1 Tax=Trichodelitschia bisporula TaxID=703511 RepID=A0A6G1I1C0_9PEZI|nr:hypothetical protein EJ06DRAFT_529177 [Trichodelitschia bisporula]
MLEKAVPWLETPIRHVSRPGQLVCRRQLAQGWYRRAGRIGFVHATNVPEASRNASRQRPSRPWPRSSEALTPLPNLSSCSGKWPKVCTGNAEDPPQLPWTCVRQYSTRPGEQPVVLSVPGHSPVGLNAPSFATEFETLGLPEELVELVLQGRAKEALERLLERTLPPPKSSIYVAIWRLYQRLDRLERTKSLTVDVLNYLSFSGSPTDFLSAFKQALWRNDDEISCWLSVLGRLQTENGFSTALMCYDEASQNAPRSYCGGNVLLAHAILRKDWAAAMRICTQTADAPWHTSGRPGLKHAWRYVAVLPGSLRLASSFLADANGTLDLTSPEVRDLCAKFIGETAWRLSTEDPVGVWKLLQEVHALRLSSPELFLPLISELCTSLVQLDRFDHAALARRKLLLDAFRLYREVHATPPWNVLKNMLSILTRSSLLPTQDVGDLTLIVVEDVHRLYRQLPIFTLLPLMNKHARAGNVETVRRLFDSLPKDDLTTRAMVRPLLYVHARRSEAEKCARQFDRLWNEFGLWPDTECWNILLYAYARANETERALLCFDDLLNSGCPPDQYSFGTLLSLCAHHGDTDSVFELLDLARQKDVAINAVMFGSLVLAYVRSDNVAAAEDAAVMLAEAQTQGKLEGQITTSWNIVLTSYAARRDYSNVQRLHKEMQRRGIPSDSLTYAALMLALCASHQTNAARKILERTMPDSGIPRLASHYAIVITGFVKQDQKFLALDVYENMLKDGIAPDASAKLAYLRAMSHDVRSEIKEPDNQTKLVDEIVKEVMAVEASELSGNDLRLGLGPWRGAPPIDSYIAHLIFNFGDAGLPQVVERLYELYQSQRVASGESRTTPIGILSALMVSDVRQGNHDAVARCWTQCYTIAVEQANLREVATGSASVSAGEGSPPFPTNTSKTISLGRKMTPLHRNMLSQPLVPYLRSLRDQERFSDIYRTVAVLLSQGFTLDHGAWNMYIQAFARTPYSAHTLAAFRACEDHLMGGFPGWAKKPLNIKWMQRRSKFLGGYEHMDVSKLSSRWHRQLAPHFETLLVLKGVATRLTEALARDQEGEVATDRALYDSLWGFAPQTMEALETMPEVKEPIRPRVEIERASSDPVDT